MKRVIWKYELSAPGHAVTLDLSKSSRVIHVGLDATGKPCLWAEVEPECPQNVPLVIMVIGTGWDISSDFQVHLGTFVECGCVWHVYGGGELP